MRVPLFVVNTAVKQGRIALIVLRIVDLVRQSVEMELVTAQKHVQLVHLTVEPVPLFAVSMAVKQGRIAIIVR